MTIAEKYRKVLEISKIKIYKAILTITVFPLNFYYFTIYTPPGEYRKNTVFRKDENYV